MEDHSDTHPLKSDNALQSPSEDKLGYNDFAKHLAQTLQRQTPEHEFVIGIYGEWGSGKSTVLNFLDHYLEEEIDNSIIVLQFNPWWFSGQHDLLEKFLLELRDGLGQDQFDDVRENLSNYARKISSIPIGTLLGYPVIDKILSDVPDTIEPDLADINTLKEKIDDGLQESENQIVVLIDDIDRLSSEETQHIFRLVKSVADFPNITYVLAFDQGVVVPALEEEGLKGNEYLEKIVQLPIHLPTPQQHSIQDIFADEFKKSVGKNWRPRNEERWIGLLENGIHPLLDTPRDAIRLSNVLNVSYNVFEEKDEINVVDLLGIEAIRLFYRDTYEKIRDQPDRFVGYPSAYSKGLHSRSDEGANDSYADLFKKDSTSEENIILKNILSYLFPRCSEEFEVNIPREAHRYSHKRRRIYDEGMYPFYFRLSVPKEGISISTIKQMIQSSPEDFRSKLMDLREERTASGRKMSYIFLNQFQGYTEDVDSDKIPSLINGSVISSEKLLEDDIESGVIYPTHKHLLSKIITRLLWNINKEKRGSILEEAISDADSNTFPTILMKKYSKDHGMFGEGSVHETERILNKQQLGSINDLITNRIRENAENNEFLESTFPFTVFSYWIEVDAEEATRWSKTVTSATDDLIEFVENIIVSRRSNHWKAEPEWFESFLDLDMIASQLEVLNKDCLSDQKQETIELFLKGKEMSDRGDNPSKGVEIQRA